jgi:hypothetical protein
MSRAGNPAGAGRSCCGTLGGARAGGALRLLRCWGGALVVFALAPSAYAELPSTTAPLDTRVDGVYGRLDGDFSLSAQVHAEWSETQSSVAPGARLEAHYFWMAGVYVSGSGVVPDSDFGHALSAGVDLRPAFLPRWSLDLQHGPAWLDLCIDSISLSLGAYTWFPARDEQARHRGFELGFGAGLPLLGRDDGLWFTARGLTRLPDAELATQWGAQLGLSWHLPWRSPLMK